MTVEQSRSILKVTGILSIVFSVFGLLLGVLAIAGGGFVASTGAGDSEAVSSGMVVAILGVLVIIGAFIGLIRGIFSLNASKDFSKIMPAWILAIIDLIFRGLTTAAQVATGTLNSSSMFSVLSNIAISVLIFMAANTIKKATGR